MSELTGDASRALRLTSVEESMAALLSISRERFLGAKQAAMRASASPARTSASATSSAARKLTAEERTFLAREGISLEEYRAARRAVAERWKALPRGTGEGEITATAWEGIQQEILDEAEPALLAPLDEEWLRQHPGRRRELLAQRAEERSRSLKAGR